MAAEKLVGPLCVLVVDDEPYGRGIVQDRLKDLGGWSLQVDGAGSGEEALKMLRGSFYDLVFLDYRLPGASGLDILEKVRQLHPKTAVVMMTGQGNEQVAVQAMKRGAMDYLTKDDLGRLDLSQLLRRVLELRYLVDQNMELRQVNQMKNEFISNVSHELRTPLSVIRGYAEAIKGGSLGAVSGDQARALDSILARSDDLLRTLNQILKVREAHDGKQQLLLKPLELRAFVKEIAGKSPRDLSKKKMTLETALPPSEVWVRAEAERLRDVIENLLANAAKFAPERTRVTLSLEAVGGEALVCVKDEGPGVAQEMLPRLFEQFAAAGQGPTRPHAGLGLGLPLSKQAVEQHGGRIWLESPPGKGCLAFMALPVASPETPAAATPEAPAPVGKKKVLVVEDNPDIVELLLIFLSRLSRSLTADSASSGFEALDKMKEGLPDLIILDVMMPGMSGFEVIERLRKVPETSRIPIMVLTGYSEAAQKARKLGADEVMLKPFDEKSFLAKVQELLRVSQPRS